jgi:hypothetical protein
MRGSYVANLIVGEAAVVVAQHFVHLCHCVVDSRRLDGVSLEKRRQHLILTAAPCKCAARHITKCEFRSLPGVKPPDNKPPSRLNMYCDCDGDIGDDP